MQRELEQMGTRPLGFDFSVCARPPACVGALGPGPQKQKHPPRSYPIQRLQATLMKQMPARSTGEKYSCEATYSNLRLEVIQKVQSACENLRLHIQKVDSLTDDHG